MANTRYNIGWQPRGYLSTSKGHQRCLNFMKKGNDHLIGQIDVDWATDPENRKSTSGFTFLLAKGTVTWGSKKQETIAMSTTEAEFIATNLACRDGMWVSNLLFELTDKSYRPIILWSDNQGSIFFSKHVGSQKKTRHMDLQCFYV